MKVSQHFGLGLSQASLEFVDVDLETDVALFIDPRAISQIDSEWTDECVALLQDFFNAVLDCIASSDHHRATELLGLLSEPNETHLGLSTDRPSGHGLGVSGAADVWRALSESEAAKSRLLEDLEDTVLMIPGIGNDLISDMTTNIIRGPLIDFTNEVCDFYGIPLANDVDSGPCWNLATRQWESGFVSLPMVENKKLLLVPKAIVRQRLGFSVSDYYRHVILVALQQHELDANSGLVETLRDGTRRVTKKSLIERYGAGTKDEVVKFTKANPGLLRMYRDLKSENPSDIPSHKDLERRTSAPAVDLDLLLRNVRDCTPGRADEDRYHRAVQALLNAVFHPSLVNPRREVKIHDGRKRIDIVYTNASAQGFFFRIRQHHSVPAGYIVVECKNYNGNVGNPELDQISSRFSPVRGQLGLLLCRNITEFATFMARCRDTFHDGRGWVLPLTDRDLEELVEEVKLDPESQTFQLLEERFADLIS